MDFHDQMDSLCGSWVTTAATTLVIPTAICTELAAVSAVPGTPVAGSIVYASCISALTALSVSCTIWTGTLLNLFTFTTVSQALKGTCG